MYQGITPVPDRVFLKRLKKIDPGLDCEFSRAYGKFVITQTGKISGKVPVAVVEGNEGGGYRYPDNRDLILLHRADMHRRGQEVRDRVQKGEEYLKGYKERHNRKVREEIRDVTKDDKHQLMRAYHDAFNMPGKGNAAFRRIEPKSRKGYVVRDKRVVKAEDVAAES